MFDLKFRYALGSRDFEEGNFELRTIYISGQRAGVLHVGGFQNRSPYPFRLLE
jgi:hypothetical protein